MPPTWLSIRVDLISGRGEKFWSRPGRIFAADARHTFVDLAAAIDAAFARWDRAHLFEFEFADGRRIGTPEYHVDDEGIIDGAVATLSQLTGGAQFVYEFDFGDSWTHLCTAAPARIDPLEVFGIIPTVPLPYWGWGTIPDQYGRRWAEAIHPRRLATFERHR